MAARWHRRGGFRSRALPGAAAVLLLTGLGFLGVAAAGQVSPPPPVPISAGPVPQVRGVPAEQAAAPRAVPPVYDRDPAARQTAPREDRTTLGPDRRPNTASADRPAVTAPPVRLSVPSLQISTPLVPLGLTATGQVEAPEQYDRAGWFSPGVLPGDRGAAVLAGHVDSTRGPAVFYRLSTLEPGAQVLVGRQDGSTARFRVDRLATYPKDEFPTVEVYATNGRELRLITCGGAFNDSERSYRDNVVVYASLMEPT